MHKERVKYFKDYSIAKKLRNEKKSNDYLELMLSNISLEDLIALKLEIAAKSAGIALYGIPIWKSIPYIVKEAMIKYAVSVTGSMAEASRFLGLSKMSIRNYLIKNDVLEFFSEDK